MDQEEIRTQLETLCDILDKEIYAITKEAENLGLAVEDMKLADGNWALAPILTAKAQALHSLVLLREGRYGYNVSVFNGGAEEA